MSKGNDPKNFGFDNVYKTDRNSAMSRKVESHYEELKKWDAAKKEKAARENEENAVNAREDINNKHSEYNAQTYEKRADKTRSEIDSKDRMDFVYSRDDIKKKKPQNISKEETKARKERAEALRQFVTEGRPNPLSREYQEAEREERVNKLNLGREDQQKREDIKNAHRKNIEARKQNQQAAKAAMDKLSQEPPLAIANYPHNPDFQLRQNPTLKQEFTIPAGLAEKVRIDGEWEREKNNKKKEKQEVKETKPLMIANFAHNERVANSPATVTDNKVMDTSTVSMAEERKALDERKKALDERKKAFAERRKALDERKKAFAEEKEAFETTAQTQAIQPSNSPITVTDNKVMDTSTVSIAERKKAFENQKNPVIQNVSKQDVPPTTMGMSVKERIAALTQVQGRRT
ncbi:MAG: hypothetical protein AABY27_01465 [Pseudomonadota bacterium]